MRVANRRRRQRYREQRTVLPAPDRLEVPDPFSVLDAAEDVLFFVVAILGNDHPNRLTERVRGGKSEHLFGRAIPREDRAGQILADDRILTPFDDRRQLSGVLFDALLSGNVASDFRDADDLAPRIPNGRDGDRYIDQRSVFSLPNRL